jgi:hypothetical protein
MKKIDREIVRLIELGRPWVFAGIHYLPAFGQYVVAWRKFVIDDVEYFSPEDTLSESVATELKRLEAR